ncbi:MAG: hypothetical protein KJ811_02355, partial [Candidatus Margulisbacteria bacterium]|nr:hypothetical protein [Candidatus Margulisiibacteriota bacterium]
AISQLGLLIGMRLHSLIFACLSSVHMLGLSYDPKVESFMKMIEQPCIDLEAPLDFAALKSSIKQVIANSPKIKATLATKSKELREKAAFNFELLGSLTPPRSD